MPVVKLWCCLPALSLDDSKYAQRHDHQQNTGRLRDSFRATQGKINANPVAELLYAPGPKMTMIGRSSAAKCR